VKGYRKALLQGISGGAWAGERIAQSRGRGRGYWIAGLAWLVLAVFLVACGQGDEGAAAAAEGGRDGGRLVIYSGRSESLVGPIIEQFEQQTGIEVEVRYGGTAEMAGVLLEEGDKSPADLFYAQDPGGLGAVEAAGLLAPLPEDILRVVPARFASEAGEWVGISGRARTVVYNREAITEPEKQLPGDLAGFSDPAWRSRLGWAPSNGSFQAMVTGMRAIWGEARTREWLAAMQANEPVVYQSNSAIVAAVGSGEIDVGLVNHYYLYRFLAEEGQEFGARNYFMPGGGPGSLIMVSGAGLLQSAGNPESGREFIRFLLSPAGQQYFADETFEYPLIGGVTLAEGLPPLAELDKQAVDIALGQLADLAGTQEMLLSLGIIE
jgi:iron(III) transport system substrate-binding protein